MIQPNRARRWAAFAAALPALGLALPPASPPLAAQTVTLPRQGDNQRSTVTQRIGLVEVSISYGSPDVAGPSGEDRRGQVWGKLVPYGMTNLGFGTCGEQCPWRGGADENTVFRVSHDILVQGQKLAAGSYGLHFVPGETEWTVIFSRNHTSWGSFTYDAAEDALRVTAKPEKAAYHHWLTYEFTDRRPDRATVHLYWEDLGLPLALAVEDPVGLYVENLRRELRSSPGFDWRGWEAAARYCLEHGVNLAEALTWAERGVSLPGIGEENFSTLTTLSGLEEANGRAAEAAATLERAMRHPSADVGALHAFGRQLLTQGKKERALRVFEANAAKHPGVWPVDVGLMRGYAAVGRTADAIRHGKLAIAKAPDPGNRQNLERLVRLLESGQPI